LSSHIPTDEERAAIAAGARARVERKLAEAEEKKKKITEELTRSHERPAPTPVQTIKLAEGLAEYRAKVASGEVFVVPRGVKKFRNSAEVIRRFLEDGRKGALDDKGQTRLVRMIEKMYQVAVSDSPRNIDAFKALMERSYGKPKPSDEALDAMAKGGVQLVYVAPPPDVPFAEEKKALPKVPEFIDAEFTEGDDNGR
jgi:hypothetical protein